MTIKFCGAAGTVTGSSHLITLDDGFTILMDCGLYQGHEEKFEEFNSNWLFDPSEIDCVILSHAHIDHSGRLPKLVKDGYKGPIICTHATRDLSTIMLMDSARIQVRDAEYQNEKEKRKGEDRILPLYEPSDVYQTITLFVSIGYETHYKVHPKVELLFRDAGHILGSASVNLKVTTSDGRKIRFGFTGDIGRPNRPILCDPKEMLQSDYLICESTYGAKLHGGQPNERKKLLNIIKQTCVENKGKLIIPAFSVGRTQEIVHMLDELENNGDLPKIPVFVDSPLAVNATEIFQMHPECFDNNLMEYMLFDPNPFGFNKLNYVRKVAESKKINKLKEACIVISASGMANAGRVRHHIFNNIEDKRSTILIVGYCAPETLGGQLRAGNKEVKIFGEAKPVLCNVQMMDSFSAHADQEEIRAFLDNQNRERMDTIFLVHGEEDGRSTLQEKLNEDGFKNVTLPLLGESFRL